MKTTFRVTISETTGSGALGGHRYDTATGVGTHRSPKRAMDLAKIDMRNRMMRRFKTDPGYMNGCPIVDTVRIERNGKTISYKENW